MVSTQVPSRPPAVPTTPRLKPSTAKDRRIRGTCNRVERLHTSPAMRLMANSPQAQPAERYEGYPPRTPPDLTQNACPLRNPHAPAARGGSGQTRICRLRECGPMQRPRKKEQISELSRLSYLDRGIKWGILSWHDDLADGPECMPAVLGGPCERMPMIVMARNGEQNSPRQPPATSTNQTFPTTSGPVPISRPRCCPVHRLEAEWHSV
jgi:hypothetical protein